MQCRLQLKIIILVICIVYCLEVWAIFKMDTCSFTCPSLSCQRNFPTSRGLNIHISRVHNETRNNESNIVGEPEGPVDGVSIGNEPGRMGLSPDLPPIGILPNVSKESDNIVEAVNKAYEEIVHFRRNLFNIPSGKVGKDFVNLLCFWLKQFNLSTALNGIALKAFMVLPALLLQKPSPKSKAKDHTECLRRRLDFWGKGDIIPILKEACLIQTKLKSSKSPRTTEDISRIFAKLVMEGKISAALKFLDNESSAGVLNLSEEVLSELKNKHPKSEDALENSLLYGPILDIPNYLYDTIDEQSVLTMALRTRGSAGPSGMDSDLYRRVLCSKSFGSVSKSLREEIASFTKNLLTKSYHPSLLEPYVASRLIPLDKNPGIRPIGVGEVLRRIVGKVISSFASEDIKIAAGPLQTCAGHGAGAESAIHAMKLAFEQDASDAVLLIDASNAFNTMNRIVGLHNIRVLCPVISCYLINTYRKPIRLFIAGGGEILSFEGTTQGDPLAMAWYSINTVVLINFLRSKSPKTTQVWLADDAAGASKIQDLFMWFKTLAAEGVKYGYLVNGPKSWLILKSPDLQEEAQNVFGQTVNITVEGKRHLGAVLGSDSYKKEYCDELVNGWVSELQVLSDIAKSQPQAAYSAFTKGFKSKFNYFERTIENFENFVEPVEDILSKSFLPTLFGLDTPFDDISRGIMALAPSKGGLGIPLLSEEAKIQFESSSTITKVHVESILDQSMFMKSSTSEGHSVEVLKQTANTNKTEKRHSSQEKLESLIPENLSPFFKQAKDKGASSWLNAIPLTNQDLDLTKDEFKDALRLRYNIPLDDLPSKCACGNKFDVNHALICAKGGFISRRHDNIRDFFTVLLDKVCVDVESEPHLSTLSGESFPLRSANKEDEARLDMKALGFWRRGKTAFFDVRVTHVNSLTNSNRPTKAIFREHEMAKKREYMDRVLQVEHASFTPLIFGSNGGMGEECHHFISALCHKLADKQCERYSDVISWLRVRLSIEIIRSTILCVRGSRVPFRKHEKTVADDFRLDNVESGVV